MSAGESGDLLKRLEPLFRPRSVAIVGASATPFKHGNVAVRYLRKGGFAGAIFPVNPAGGEIEGISAWRSIADLPGEVDCALFLIPAAATNDAVRACAAKGVRALILGSNGFAELGNDEGRARQRELMQIARGNNICVLGPNTNGVWNASHKLSLGYNTSHGDPMTPGAISIAAHSGALFNSLAPALRAFGGGLSKYVPVGNEADLDILDIFEFLISDPDTRVIGLIVESLRDGERLRKLAREAHEAGKPVAVLKLGRSKAGAAAAQAHASRLAGSARAYDALFASCGFLRVMSVEALAGACALLESDAATSSHGDCGLLGVSTSGGGAEIIADLAADHGIPLAGGGDGHWGESAERFAVSLPGAGLVRNPVDAGNLGGVQNIDGLLKAAEEDGCMGPVVLYAHMLPQEARDLLVAKILIERRKRSGTPVVCIAPGGLRPGVASFYRENGVPVFRDTTTGFAALRCWYGWCNRTFDTGEAPVLAARARIALVKMFETPRNDTLLTEVESAAILSASGAPMVESQPVASLPEAGVHLHHHGGPLVLKAIAPGVAHKNDAGLVATGLLSPKDLERAWRAMDKALSQAGIPRETCGFILQPMLPSRAELIAGVSHEPPLGHFLIAGLGGLMAEALDEVVMIAVPASRATIAAALAASRLGPLLAKLDAARPQTAHATSGLLDTLCALQALTLAFPARIRSIDVNPLLVGADHCTAVDALIELQPAAQIEEPAEESAGED